MNNIKPSPDLLQLAVQAFRSDLPDLLARERNRWVLYHGSTRIAIADGQWDLFDECTRRGLNAEDCLIQPIIDEPDAVDPTAWN